MSLRNHLHLLGFAGLAFTATMPAANAFFPPVPQPGEVITVVPPTTQPPVVVPPVPVVPPPVKPPVKPIEKPNCTCPDPEGPQRVPEPATIVACVTGLAALAAAKRRKNPI